MKQIIKILPNGMSWTTRVVMSNTDNAENRQTMLFSATQTTKVTDLARISLRPGPLYINVDSSKEASTVDMLEQGYVVCDSDQRFMLLFTFLKKNLKKKVIVFFSSCNSVKYHAELLNYIDVPVLDLHVSSFLFSSNDDLTGRENKNNKNEQTHSLNSVMPQLVSYSVQT
jgi:ATP-dependent RNA helicase DDX18/HAS1